MAIHLNTGTRFTTSSPLEVESVGPEGKQAMNTIFGEVTVGTRHDDVSCQFQYNNSTRDVLSTISGTGTTSNADSQAIVSSGTGVGEASIVSIDAVRYQPGHECLTMFTSGFIGTPDANSYMQHGLFSGEDGFWFGYKGTDFGVAMLRGGVETFYPQTAWNKDKLDGTGVTGFDLVPSNLNIYKISYGWLGIAPIFFSVYSGSDNGWVLCHVIDFVNTQSFPHILNPSLPVQAKCSRSSGTGNDLQIKTSSWRAGIVGEENELNSSSRVFSKTVISKIVSTTETPVITLRNNTTFQSKNNQVKIELMVVNFTTDGAKAVVFTGRKGATLTGATFNAVDVNNSTMSFDVAATSFTGGTEGAATVLGKVDRARTDVRGTGLVIYPGETFLITGKAAGTTSDVSVSVRWVEYF